MPTKSDLVKTCQQIRTVLKDLRAKLRQGDYKAASDLADNATEIILDAFIEGESSPAHMPEVLASSRFSSGTFTCGGCTSPVVAMAGV